MSTVAGIDFDSFACHVVLLSEDDDTAEFHHFPFGVKGEDAFDRSRRVREALPSRSWWLDHCFAVGIEDPRGAARSVDSILYRVQGAVLACLPQSLMVCPWKPQSWRSEIGIGHKGKQVAADFALARWSNIPAGVTQDAADAFCVAWATRQRLVKSIAA